MSFDYTYSAYLYILHTYFINGSFSNDCLTVVYSRDVFTIDITQLCTGLRGMSPGIIILNVGQLICA